LKLQTREESARGRGQRGGAEKYDQPNRGEGNRFWKWKTEPELDYASDLKKLSSWG